MKRIADLEIGAVETVVGSVTEAKNVTGRNGKVRTEALIGDESGVIKVVWFNQPYLASQLQERRPRCPERQDRRLPGPQGHGVTRARRDGH